MTTPETDAELEVAASPWIDDDGWAHLHHPVTFGKTRVANDPTVIASFVGRGWAYSPPPPPPPVVVVPAPDAPAEPAAPADKAEETGAAGSDAATTGLVPSGSMAVVLDWVGDDPARAAMALAVENAAAAPRTSLIPKLEALAAGSNTTGLEADNG